MRASNVCSGIANRFKAEVNLDQKNRINSQTSYLLKRIFYSICTVYVQSVSLIPILS